MIVWIVLQAMAAGANNGSMSANEAVRVLQRSDMPDDSLTSAALACLLDPAFSAQQNLAEMICTLAECSQMHIALQIFFQLNAAGQ